MASKKPKWHTEAIDQGIDYIVLVYGKAEGFVFCPSNFELPFRVGGDYDGNFPTTAEGALSHFNSYFNKAYLEEVRWFIKYVNKIKNSEDFSLSELEVEKRKLRVISGRWPW